MKQFISILLLIICMVLQIQSIAQVKKPKAKPSTQQMPDMEKMLKELPADQRAMAKKMLTNATGTMTNKEEAVTKAPSPIVKIYLKQPLQVPTQAQAKDHLLWYKGKKMNDSMLVTTKAMVVLYSKKRSMVIAQPLEEKDSFRLMVKNVSKEAKMTEDYINNEAAKQNSFMNYPLIQMTVDKFQEIDELFNNAIKNTIDLPEIPTSMGPTKAKGSDINEYDTPEQRLKEMHNRLKQLLQNEPDMHVDAPPKENFSISYQCDENTKGKYPDEVKKWTEEFQEYESSLIRLSMGIERSIQLFFVDDAVAERISPGITEDIQKAFDRYFSRLDEKLKQLISRYGKNIFMQRCVIITVLGLERQKQLLGKSETGTDLFKEIFELMNGPEFENYINEQIDKKNWDVVLNISFVMGRNRQAQLFCLSNDLIDRLYKLTDRLIKLNRFALTVDIDFNVQYPDDEGKVELKANGTIQTTDKVFVSLVLSGCKWTLMQTEVYVGKIYTGAGKEAAYFPMQVTGGIKSIKTDEGWKDFSYSGSKDMVMYYPVFRIDFSDKQEQDTATLQAVKYQSLDDYSVGESYTTDILAYLNAVFVVYVKTAAKEKEAEDMGKEMMEKFLVLTTMPNSTTTLGKLKDQYLLMLQKQAAEKGIADVANTAKAVVLFKAQNNSSVLVDDKVDTKHKDEQVDVLKGIIKIKVVHDPVTD